MRGAVAEMKRAGTFIGEVWQLLHQNLPRPDPGQRRQLQLVASGAAGQPQVELRHVGVEGLQLGPTRPAAVHCRDHTQEQAAHAWESNSGPRPKKDPRWSQTLSKFACLLLCAEDPSRPEALLLT